MLDIVIKGIQILQALYNLREELKENNRSCANLCERAGQFEKFLEEWKDRLPTSSRPGSGLPTVRHVVSAAESSIHGLVKLLKEIEEYVRPFVEDKKSFFKVKTICDKRYLS
jgi:hypothetical protein